MLRRQASPAIAMISSLPGPGLQKRLKIGEVDDPAEREAEEVARHVVRNTVSPVTGSALVQRTCDGCAAATAIQRSPAALPLLAAASAGGRPLPPESRAEMEHGFGVDFQPVRIHTDEGAAQLSRSLGAIAFTHGTDIYFDSGRFQPHSSEGKHLLGHELTHVVQQSRAGASRTIQRTTHSGTTPTNCHNWRIPLPPWIAGTIAHGQISARLGILPHSIPRATKLAMGIPHPPWFTPDGFADLWSQAVGAVRIAEIKSTQTGDAVARAEAAHYILRHDEWLARAPHTAMDDIGYFEAQGELLSIGALLDLSSRTGTDMNLGFFWGDPLKQLHVEGDSTGSVVYWCTGQGSPVSPLWYPVFRRAMNELRNRLNEGMRQLGELVDAITAGAQWAMARVRAWIGSIVDWGTEHSKALALLLLIIICLIAIVLLILSIIAEPVSGGTSTVPAVLSLAALGASAAGILMLLGISSPELPQASANVAMSLAPDLANAAASGADYDRDTGRAPPSTSAAAAVMTPDVTVDFLAALSPLLDPVAIFRAAAGSFTTVDPAAVAQLRRGVALLEQHGDRATSSTITAIMGRVNVS